MSGVPPRLQVSGAPVEEDKLSDYVPQSGDLSRQPTASASVSRVQSKAPSEEDVQDDSEDEMADDDDEGDASTSKAQVSRDREEARKKRAAQASDLSTTRAKQNSRKVADSMKRFTYLLGQTELFQHFIDIKKDRDPEFAKLLAESQNKANAKKAGKGKRRGGASDDNEGGSRRRKTEKEEDEELLQDNDDDEEQFVFHESPPYVKGGTMRDYQ